MKTEQADVIAFELVASNERVVEEYTLLLPRNIFDSKEKAINLLWPPSAHFVIRETTNLLDRHQLFLTVLVFGKNLDTASEKERPDL